MRTTIAQYAKSLYEATKNKSQSETDVLVENFVKVLVKNKQTNLAVKIIKRFQEIHNKENGVAETEVISREKLSDELISRIIDFVKEKYDIREVIINNKINGKIKGGIILKIRDEVLDMSVERQLKELEKSLNR